MTIKFKPSSKTYTFTVQEAIHYLKFDKYKALRDLNGHYYIMREGKIVEYDPFGLILRDDSKFTYKDRYLFEIGTWYEYVSSSEVEFKKHPIQIKKENTGMKEAIGNYIKENKNVLITIALVIIIDKLVLKGAFTSKLKNIIDKFLDNTDKQLEKKE